MLNDFDILTVSKTNFKFLSNDLKHIFLKRFVALKSGNAKSAIKKTLGERRLEKGGNTHTRFMWVCVCYSHMYEFM